MHSVFSNLETKILVKFLHTNSVYIPLSIFLNAHFKGQLDCLVVGALQRGRNLSVTPVDKLFVPRAKPFLFGGDIMQTWVHFFSEIPFFF
jgi:hypothetical protein